MVKKHNMIKQPIIATYVNKRRFLLFIPKSHVILVLAIMIGMLTASHKTVQASDPIAIRQDDPAREWLNAFLDNRTIDQLAYLNSEDEGLQCLYCGTSSNSIDQIAYTAGHRVTIGDDLLQGSRSALSPGEFSRRIVVEPQMHSAFMENALWASIFAALNERLGGEEQPLKILGALNRSNNAAPKPGRILQSSLDNTEKWSYSVNLSLPNDWRAMEHLSSLPKGDDVSHQIRQKDKTNEILFRVDLLHEDWSWSTDTRGRTFPLSIYLDANQIKERNIVDPHSIKRVVYHRRAKY